MMVSEAEKTNDKITKAINASNNVAPFFPKVVIGLHLHFIKAVFNNII
jgi:hypothetical protein